MAVIRDSRVKQNVSEEVILADDLCPDGVRVVVYWSKMLVGMSVFVPCIDTQAAYLQAKQIMESKGWTFEHQVRTEDNKLGVRFWRTT